MKPSLVILLLLLFSAAFSLEYDDHDLDEEEDSTFVLDEITKLKKSSKEKLDEQRKGTMDRQCVYLIFRANHIKKKGLVTLSNDFNKQLYYKDSVVVEEYVQIGWDKVGCCVTSISDMMSIKDFGKTRKSILMVQSGQERLMGQYVTEPEKKNYYKRAKLNAVKKAEYDAKHPKPKEEKKEKKKKLSPEEMEEMKQKLMNDPSVLDKAFNGAFNEDL